MSGKTSEFLDVLGCTMHLGCQATELSALKSAVTTLNRVSDEIREAHPLVSREDLAILCALTLAHELNQRNQEAMEFLQLSDELKAVLA